MLLGSKESVWLECKANPYDLSNDYYRQELAKDVSAFANSSEGGILLIGARTKKSKTTAEDIISDISGMSETSLSKMDYLNILETWVYPRISGLSIDWMKEQGTDKVCLP